jgi:hypothetical protein
MNIKKAIYIISSMFLGFLFSLIVHAKLEIWYIGKMLASGVTPVSFGRQEYLPPLVSILLIVVGLIFGYVIGQRWWQLVYVEKRHWRWKNKK